MKATLWLAVVVSLLLGVSGAIAEEVAGLPLHVQRLDPKAIRVWIGDTISSTATVAIATEKGIVVVDTLGYPKVDAELRKIIARELGSNDFKMLINTHEHGDHTGGNSVYADCTIVGHELVAAGMEAAAGRREESVQWCARRGTELQQERAKQSDEKAAKALDEELALNRLSHDALAADVKPVLPTKTFKNRAKLDMGDTTFELTYIGGMHSASDIAIFVPEHGLLMTGDTMADRWLTDTPGCLASFMAREGVRHDFPLLLENWGLLLAKKDQIKLLLPGHWNGELSFAGFEARVNYVKTLWEEINRPAEASKTLAELWTAYKLETRFPELAKSPGFSARGNSATIAEIWKVVTKQESAAFKLYTLVNEGAAEDAIRQVVAERGAKTPKYYFDENDINGRGYWFLQLDKVPQAIAMFRVNVELFPNSWNVYDSLGEALLKAGDTAGATTMYEKSLALNPESPSGKAVLARIRGGAGSSSSESTLLPPPAGSRR